MPDLDPFSESNLTELKIFSQKLKRRYNAISRITLHHGAELEEHPYVLVIDLQNKEKSEYNGARDDLSWENIYFWRDIKWLPECIRDQENSWWVEPKGINEEFPHIWALEDTGYVLYKDDNLRWQNIKASMQGENGILDINEMCKKAKYSNQIDILELAHILGCDDQYNDLLPKLFEKYQVSIFKNDNPPDFKTETGKIGIWFNLLQRFGFAYDNSPFPLNKKIPTFQGINGNPELISLDELRKYFTEFLEIPLPLKLFPPIEMEEKKTSENISLLTGNSEEYFPELHLHLLKIQAKRWVKKYHEASIQRVLLYSFSSPFEGYMREQGVTSKPLPIKYAVVFEVDAEDTTVGMDHDEQEKWDLKRLNGERPLESYERLQGDTGEYQAIRDKEPNIHFINADFENIYEHPPANNFRKEWVFRVRFKNTELNANIKTDEPHIVLWDQAESSQKPHKIMMQANNSVKQAESGRTPLVVNFNHYNFNSGRVGKKENHPENQIFPSEKEIRKNSFLISSDKNLKWKDITITFLSDVEMHIQFKEDGNGKNVTRRFDHLGFGDGRKKNAVAIQAWNVLFYAAKEQKIPHVFKNRRKIEATVKTMRQKLKQLFPNIDEDPIPHLKKDQSYHFAFHLKPPDNSC